MHSSLSSWLSWQETLHPSTIDLGLDRVRVVLRRLGFQKPDVPVITIAGTKGKGSCAAMLDSIYAASDYRTGVFTSPHLQRYNERIRINQQEVSDESLCIAFERIDAARGDISLTYFEFNTLAALLTFSTAALDVWILEIGMGGRLDAVNVIDSDIAMVTSIGLDHTEWLGNDLESIGREKAGVFRANRPALYGSATMPKSIQQVANEVGAYLLKADRDFGFDEEGQIWSWWMKQNDRQMELKPLSAPGIEGSIQKWNASLVLAAVQLLSLRLPVTQQAINAGLVNTKTSGRFQRVVPKNSSAEWILDVAHNPMSALVLAQHLYEDRTRCGATEKPTTLAIFGMLSDKDIDGTITALRDEVDEWIAVTLPGTRALTATQVAEHLRHSDVSVAAELNSIDKACDLAGRRANIDRIVVCGSFHAVGPALAWLERRTE